MKQIRIKLVVISVVAGTIFGLFCMLMEQITGLKIYTLLVNVDYVPILKNLDLPGWIEFAIHLIICVVLTGLLAYIVQEFQWHTRQILWNTLWINGVIGVLLYSTTALSDRTPSITSLSAFTLWIVAHLLFGSILGALLVYILRNNVRGD